MNQSLFLYQGRVLYTQSFAIKADIKSLFNNIDGYQLY